MPLPDEFRVGEWLAYRQLNRVAKGGDVRSVEPKIMDLLCYFAEHRNEVLPKARLIQAIWPDVFVGDEVLTYSVSELRKALGDDARAPRYIETIPRRGYRLIASISADKPKAVKRWLGSLVRFATRWNQTGRDSGRVGFRPYWLALPAVVALSVTLLGVAGLLTRGSEDRKPPPAQVIRSAIELPTDTGLAGSLWAGVSRPDRTEIALSPDGQVLVFSAGLPADPTNVMLYRRPLKGDQAHPFAGTEGGRQPVFSPDGKWMAYWVLGGRLMKIPRDGGIPVEIASGVSEPMGIFWTQDGRILLGGNRSGLQWVPTQGGKVRPLTRLDTTREVRHSLPSVLPGGDQVLFTASPQYSGVGARVEAARLSTGERKVLLENASDARYVGTGHLLFLRQGQVMAVPFDPAGVRVTGAVVPVQDDVQQALNLGVDNANSGAAQYAVSPNGLFVYAQGGIRESSESELVWVDRQGRVETVSGFEKPLLAQLSLSPDGRSVAFTEEASSGFLWLFDLRRATHSRLSPPGVATCPVWSPDGRRLAFTWSAEGPPDIWEVSVDGGAPRRITSADACLNSSSWSRDGKLALVQSSESSHSGLDILIYNSTSQTLVPFFATPANEMYPQFSPDGRWLAYVSDETGQPEVYVSSLADPGRKAMISNAGGICPLWAPSGTELFYRENGPAARFMKVDLELGPAANAALPESLFDTAGLNLTFTTPVWGSNVSSDGQRFLFSRRKPRGEPDDEREAVTRLTLVSNWFEELNRLCPSR